MDETITCHCAFRTDLERAEDVFAFLEENYPIPSILKNFKSMPPQEQRCACCLLGNALLILEEKHKKKRKWFSWFRRKKRF